MVTSYLSILREKCVTYVKLTKATKPVKISSQLTQVVMVTVGGIIQL